MVVLGFGVAPTVRAQSSASLPGANRSPGGIRFRISDVFMETRTEYERNRDVVFGRSGNSDRVLTYRDTALEERLGLGFEGDIYHPDLFDYKVDFKVGARHEWFYRNFPSIRNREYEAGPILEYDARADFFRNKLIAGTVNARQIERFVPREFQLSQRDTITTLGGDVRYRSRDLPMRFAIKRFTSDVNGIDQDVPGQDLEETTFNYELEWRPSRDRRLSLDYEYLDRLTSQSTGTDVIDIVQRWHDLDILDDLRWGPGQKHQLQTLFELRDEGGTFPQDRVRLNPRLRTRHNQQLETRAAYLLNEQEFSGVRNLSQRIDLGVTRRIYESLTLDGDIFAEVEDIPDANRGWFFGNNLNAAYRKKTSLGRLLASVGGSFSSRQLDNARSTSPVVREPATFRGAVPTRLDRDDIVLSSIRVRSLDETELYQRERDFRVVAYGRKTALVRKIGGRIRDGETTLVSYLYEVPASSRFDNTILNADIAHLFDNGLKPYYRFALQDQEVTTRNLIPVQEEDITDHTFGIEFRKPRLTLGAEYDIHNSSLYPDEGFRLWSSAELIDRPKTHLNWTLSYSDFAFRGVVSRKTQRFESGLIFDQELTRTVLLSTSARYANEDDTFDLRTEGFSVEGALKWMVRDVEVELRVEHHQLRDRVQDSTDTRVWLNVRRTFIR